MFDSRFFLLNQSFIRYKHCVELFSVKVSQLSLMVISFSVCFFLYVLLFDVAVASVSSM